MSSSAFATCTTLFSPAHSKSVPSVSRSPPRRPRITARLPPPHDLHIDPSEPAFIPQTIEYAIRRAKTATAHALSSGLTHVRVELPMGRSRKHWYRMSPLEAWYTETSVLAFHFCEMFKGLHITLILGQGPGVVHKTAWIGDLCRVEDAHKHHFSTASDRVVVIAGVAQAQRAVISEILSLVPDARAYVLFNSLLDVPLSQDLAPFKTAYACRAFDKCAALKECFDGPWAGFAEIAVFEYEWIGATKETPTQRGIETLAGKRGAKQQGMNGYYETKFAGCEAGFWPFMTACCREVLPMDGSLMAEVEMQKTEKKARKSSRPFGFF